MEISNDDVFTTLFKLDEVTEMSDGVIPDCISKWNEKSVSLKKPFDSIIHSLSILGREKRLRRPLSQAFRKIKKVLCRDNIGTNLLFYLGVPRYGFIDKIYDGESLVAFADQDPDNARALLIESCIYIFCLEISIDENGFATVCLGKMYDGYRIIDDTKKKKTRRAA